MENIQECNYVHCKTSWIGIFNYLRALITTVKLKQFLYKAVNALEAPGG
jgi:hypothetical protein